MAITMSSATVESDLRDALLTSSVDTSVVSGGEVGNTTTEGGFFGLGGTEVATGAAFAGISAEFLTSITEAIDSYIGDVNAKLDELETTASPSDAFKGTSVNNALTQFVTSVKTVAKDYTSKLRDAEAQIVEGVHAAYEKQDSDISINLGSDSDSLV